MKRRRLASIAGLTVISTVIGLGAAGSGEAATVFAPEAGPVFNDPEGTTTEQYAIMRQIEQNVDTAPRGSVIRIAVYSITLGDFVDKLIAAHKRGVSVKVLMDTHGKNPLWSRLVSALGSRFSARGTSSYALPCSGGCVAHYYAGGKPEGALHTKFYLFSGGGKRTVTLSSANPTRAQAEVAWNNGYTSVGDTGLYNAYVTTFSDMAKGAAGTHKPDYYWTDGSNPKAYFWPKAQGGSDTVLSMLKLVTCSRTHPSQVRLAVFEWTGYRIAVARQLATMAANGCKVTVLYTKGAVDPSVRSTLARSKADVRDSSHGTDANGYAAHYTHDKYLLIDGWYNGVGGRRVVMTGSANYTANGLYHNDESDMKITSSATYLAYRKDFDAQLAAASSADAKLRALGRLPTIPVDPSQVDDS